MKKYFILLNPYKSDLYYLDEENGMLKYVDSHVSVYAFKYDAEDVDFEAIDKAIKDVRFIFYQENSLNKDVKYNVIVQKYLEFLINKFDKDGEYIFICPYHYDSIQYKSIRKALGKIKSKYKIHKKLVYFHFALGYFMNRYLTFKENDNIMILGDYLFTLNDESVFYISDHYQNLKQLYDKYYHELAHANITNQEDFVINKIFALFLNDRKKDDYIYCRDYRILIEELEDDTYLDYLYFNKVSSKIDKLINKDNNKIYLINTINNIKVSKFIMKDLDNLPYEIEEIDHIKFTFNFFKYIYNLMIANENAGKLSMKYQILTKRSNFNDIIDFRTKYAFIEDVDLYFNVDAIINEQPSLKDKTLNVEKINLDSLVYL
ncbi:TPA: hypothetical protein GXZ54_03795 [bacterium]|nr:hypothetical protein [bacterium]